MTSVYQAMRFWSPATGDYCQRISIVDAHNREVFMIVDDGQPKMRRARRAAAIEFIEAAIDRGDQPGEVRVSGVLWDRAVEGYLQERTG